MSSPNSAPATKADLNLVRNELRGVASGLEQAQFDIREIKAVMATKADLNQLRNDLDLKIKPIAIGLVQTQAEMREMKAVMSTKNDINRVLTAIDAFAGKSQNSERAMTLHGQAPTEVQVQLKDHERRIKTLETRGDVNA